MNQTNLKHACVINHCSLGRDFIRPCIDQTLKICDQVVVVVCDHLLDGTPEPETYFLDLARLYPDVRWLMFPYSDQWTKSYGPHFGINLGRWLGYLALDECEGVFFLDDDEIMDADRIKEWFISSFLNSVRTVTFEAYWYFRDICYRAKQTEYAGTWIKKTTISPKQVFSKRERYALNGRKTWKRVLGLDGQPMVHHLSWVRTKEQMLHKVRSWGHQQERDWEALVYKEFEAPFSGQDFVHQYSFDTVDPLDLMSISERQAVDTDSLNNLEHKTVKQVEEILEKLPQWLLWANRKGLW